MVVHVGSEEILLEDAVRLAVAARAAGVPVELRRLDGLWHVAHASAGMVAASTTAVTTLGAGLATHLARADAPPPGRLSVRPSRYPCAAAPDSARGGGSWPARPVLAANTNSRRGSCSWPSETTSRRNSDASVQSATTRALRLKVGTRLTW